jgi:c-di-GMP-binding flagellar brake protein YcgR
MTLDTLPMPLDSLSAAGGGLDEFRVHLPVEVHALLRRLQDGNVPLYLHAPGGAMLTTTLWAVDTARQSLSLAANGDDSQVDRLLEATEITAVGYLDSVKLQFELQGAMLVRSGPHCAISVQLPRELFRFQRRGAYRVRPLLRNMPLARLAHPSIPDMTLALRVLDVSVGGCALFLPDDVPPIAAGVRLNGVEIELDADTRLRVGLNLQHVTAIRPDSGGTRLGCEWLGLGGEGGRLLQLFIDQTQKRRRLLAMD